MGDIAGKCALLQELLGGLLRDSAASSAALMAGHDDCVRLQEHTALLSKQFSHAAMQAREQPEAECCSNAERTTASTNAGSGRPTRPAHLRQNQDGGAAPGAGGYRCAESQYRARLAVPCGNVRLPARSLARSSLLPRMSGEQRDEAKAEAAVLVCVQHAACCELCSARAVR